MVNDSMHKSKQVNPLEHEVKAWTSVAADVESASRGPLRQFQALPIDVKHQSTVGDKP